MIGSISENGEAGYALLDALVGLALASVVAAITTASLRSTSELYRRAAEEGRSYRDIMEAMTGLSAWLNRVPPPSGNNTLAEYPFSPGPAAAHSSIMRRIPGTIESLIFDPMKANVEPVKLLVARKISFSWQSNGRALTPDLLELQITNIDNTRIDKILFQHSRFIYAIQVALPFN